MSVPPAVALIVNVVALMIVFTKYFVAAVTPPTVLVNSIGILAVKFAVLAHVNASVAATEAVILTE